jgi:hypothetical protein
MITKKQAEELPKFPDDNTETPKTKSVKSKKKPRVQKGSSKAKSLKGAQKEKKQEKSQPKKRITIDDKLNILTFALRHVKEIKNDSKLLSSINKLIEEARSIKPLLSIPFTNL